MHADFFKLVVAQRTCYKHDTTLPNHKMDDCGKMPEEPTVAGGLTIGHKGVRNLPPLPEPRPSSRPIVSGCFPLTLLTGGPASLCVLASQLRPHAGPRSSRVKCAHLLVCPFLVKEGLWPLGCCPLSPGWPPPQHEPTDSTSQAPGCQGPPQGLGPHDPTLPTWNP